MILIIVTPVSPVGPVDDTAPKADFQAFSVMMPGIFSNGCLPPKANEAEYATIALWT